jgi:DNA-binding FrmR family transcriptional regulator
MATMDSANPGYIEDKDDLTKRLRRIAGQVNGVERMVEDERYCIDILTQISAIRSALDRVAIAVLDDHARHCVVAAAEGERDERTTEMMDAVARLLKSR